MLAVDNKCITVQGIKTQNSCAEHLLETKVLQKSTGTVKVKDFLDVFQESKCAVRSINYFLFVLRFSNFLTENSCLCS